MDVACMLVCRDELQWYIFLDKMISDETMSYINIIGPIVQHFIVCDRNNVCVVTQDR